MATSAYGGSELFAWAAEYLSISVDQVRIIRNNSCCNFAQYNALGARGNLFAVCVCNRRSFALMVECVHRDGFFIVIKNATLMGGMFASIWIGWEFGREIFYGVFGMFHNILKLHF